jgi:hypothetical protein
VTKESKRWWKKIGSPPYAKSKNDVCQCLSKTSINIEDPSTGVITAKALNINNTVIVMNGIKIRLFLKPGILKVLLVTRRFVIEMVVLIPA